MKVGEFGRPLGRFVIEVHCRQPVLGRADNASCVKMKAKLASEKGERETD
jgi:hypothetical protein